MTCCHICRCSPSLFPASLAPCRLLWGIPGRSNALNIAQRLGLDPEVVAAARGKLGTEAVQVCVRECVGSACVCYVCVCLICHSCAVVCMRHVGSRCHNV